MKILIVLKQDPSRQIEPINGKYPYTPPGTSLCVYVLDVAAALEIEEE